MKRLEYPFNHEWHVAINKHSDSCMENNQDWPSFMYEAKAMADEVPRMAMLFSLERTNKLPKTHKQCSRQAPVPVPNNHLKCCIGVKCSDCPALLALEGISRSTPEEIDLAKAWTCASHISSSGGDLAGEGYINTVDDRMYWDNVYQNLAQSGQE